MKPAYAISSYVMRRVSARSWFALIVMALLLTGLSNGVPAYAQSVPDISGTWRGTLVAGQLEPLQIIFRIQGSAGNYSATLDIPAHARLGLPADSVSVSGSNVTIRLDTLQAEYYASLVMLDDGSAVDSLNGDWSQSGEHIPLRMSRDIP